MSPSACTLGIGQPKCGRSSGPRVAQAACPRAPGAAQRLPAATPPGIGCAAESAPRGNEERGSLCSRPGWASHVREPRCKGVLRKQPGPRPLRVHDEKDEVCHCYFVLYRKVTFYKYVFIALLRTNIFHLPAPFVIFVLIFLGSASILSQQGLMFSVYSIISYYPCFTPHWIEVYETLDLHSHDN